MNQEDDQIGDLIIRTLFEQQPTIDLVLTALQPTSPIEPCLRTKFIEEGEWASANREAFVPSLVIREARTEDYDDLMPLFERDAPDLIQEYGKFFVSDLIKNNRTRCLVAERNDEEQLDLLVLNRILTLLIMLTVTI